MALQRLSKYITEYSVRNKKDMAYPVYSVTNSAGFCVDYFGKDVSSKNKTTYKIVPRGCFAYNPSRINVGSIDCQTKEDAVIVSPLYVVFKTSSSLSNDYLLYFLKSTIGQSLIRSCTVGSVRANLKFKTLAGIELNVPSLPVQESMVASLKSIEANISILQSEITLLDETVKSLFIEMFGDPTKAGEEKLISIGDIGKLTSGGTPSRGKPQYFQGTIPWFTAGELNTKFLSDSIEHISEEALDNSSAKLFDPGSLMIGMYDTAAFKMGILTQKSSSNQACANLVPSEDYNVEWLYHCFELMKEKYLEERHGARQNNLSLTIIKKLMFPRAEKAKQDQFVATVSKIDKLRFNALPLSKTKS